jgi:hypothetical protein
MERVETANEALFEGEGSTENQADGLRVLKEHFGKI